MYAKFACIFILFFSFILNIEISPKRSDGYHVTNMQEHVLIVVVILPMKVIID